MATKKQPDVKSPVDAVPQRRATDGKDKRVRADGLPYKHVPRKNPNMSRKHRSPTGPEAVAMAEKKVKGLQMRKNGASYEVIASTLGWNSPQAAHDAISRALMEMVREPAEEVIRLELRRLDELFIKPFEAAARQGDLQSLAGVMNIMNRRAKLLGLDAPEKKELTGADGKDLLLPPTTIIINGPAEEGEPVVMGESIVEQTQ